ncbi:MBL fold metallo-hydrolase [Dyadobacter psychrotolerans]|uniref:MBL fold metallo-hydrolase n=1 Tax=Dyadobacter psychrotolerans TaxID=2541721 RepID=A0A4R5DB34_9BACT|nr:MBL fold metallo-hydrolase [Dyadobacter psychrotolerans]TDE09190.1 MBL fold metallo-hydrolase [Dyadobacter psychrotolerans]
MHFEQIYTGCLAQGAYYIESDGEAAVIDPLREVEPYLEMAEKRGAKIKYVFETHFHADFVSGHIDLAQKTGADIVYGPTAKPEFGAVIAADGQQFHIGKITLTAIHTPGHTMESTCYLLKDEDDKEIALFTGDTLFIGDVGRPDLAQKIDNGLNEQILAGYLFESLRSKIMPLSNEIMVYPSHGAGSACGKNMSMPASDTLGNQKRYNYALRKDMSREQFIKEVTAGLSAPPAYFPLNVMMKIKGYESIDLVLKRGNMALDPEQFENAANETGALILDTRDAEAFSNGFIPNSINIGINGGFAPWVGSLIPDTHQPILLVCEIGREEEVITRLARVGYDFTIGYLKSGFEAWRNSGKQVDRINSITAEQMAENFMDMPGATILDVRKRSEYEAEHVTGALNIPLDEINSMLAGIEKDKTHFVHCATGYRSMIFNSILRARGYGRLIDIKGGFKAVKQHGAIKISQYVCPLNI